MTIKESFTLNQISGGIKTTNKRKSDYNCNLTVRLCRGWKVVRVTFIDDPSEARTRLLAGLVVIITNDRSH